MPYVFPWFNIITCIVAIFALLVSVWSLYYSYKSHKTSVNALKHTKEAFTIQNRPYLNVKLIKFDDTDLYLRFIPNDKTFNLAVRFKVTNVGVTPATNITIPIHTINSKDFFPNNKPSEFYLPPNITLGHGESKAYIWDNEIGYGDFTAQETKENFESGKLEAKVGMVWNYNSPLSKNTIYASSIAYLVKNKNAVLVKSEMD